MADDNLYTAKQSGTFRLDSGADYVLKEDETQLAEGHPLVKKRPDLFKAPAEAKPSRRRRG